MRRRKPFLLMPLFAIALMGFFAFSGVAAAPAEMPQTATSSAAVATSTLALADAARITRVKAGEPIIVKLTAYNAVPAQTDSNPSVTASGARSNPEVVAARSVDLAGDLPFGTIVALTGPEKDSENCRFNGVNHLIGYRVIADSMASRKREQVDVLLDIADTVPVHGAETNPSLALGFCQGIEVHVVGHINIKQIPATQEELRKLVEGDKVAMR